MSSCIETSHSVLRWSPKDSAMIEDIVRNDVLLTFWLDWLAEHERRVAAGKTRLLFLNNRADYKDHYTATRAMTAEMMAAKAKNA